MLPSVEVIDRWDHSQMSVLKNNFLFLPLFTNYLINQARTNREPQTARLWMPMAAITTKEYFIIANHGRINYGRWRCNITWGFDSSKYKIMPPAGPILAHPNTAKHITPSSSKTTTNHRLCGVSTLEQEEFRHLDGCCCIPCGAQAGVSGYGTIK